jgi:ubiquinone/menaquinone biosynthesis C-methylase UbiE
VKKSTVPQFQEREIVNAYFHSQSFFWKNIYTSGGVYAEIHRNRHTTTLDWIDSLALVPGSHALDIGCGAGLMSVALSQRGFRVHAIDSVEAMIEQARKRAEENGTTDLLNVDIGDVYALAFEEDSFDLVVALGVIPWLERPELAIQEMARVTKPDGYVILTADNRARLTNLLDPWLNPVFVPFKYRVKNSLVRMGLRRRSSEDAGATCHSRRFIDDALTQVGLVKTKSITLGFGPFSLFRRRVIPEPLGIALHYRLQHLVDRNIPGFRSAGAHYIVLARKSSSRLSSHRRAPGTRL